MYNDVNDTVIVKSIIELAHNLGITVTAEGVEDIQTMQQLKEFGCEMAQGFYIAKPMPQHEMLSWLKSYSAHVQTTKF